VVRVRGSAIAPLPNQAGQFGQQRCNGGADGSRTQNAADRGTGELEAASEIGPPQTVVAVGGRGPPRGQSSHSQLALELVEKRCERQARMRVGSL